MVKSDRMSASTDGKMIIKDFKYGNLKDDVYKTNGTITEMSEKSKTMYGSIRYKKNGIAKSLNKIQTQNNLRNSDT